MEVYDFTEDAIRAGEVAEEIDYLGVSQLSEVRNMIEKLKEQEKEERYRERKECFNVVVLPMLKTMAQEEGCKLTIEQKGMVVEAYFEDQNTLSLDLKSSCRKLIFSAFDFITLEQQESGYRIVCSFDLSE